MVAEAGPNLGLTSGWSPSDTGWGGPYNDDMARLDALTYCAVLNSTTTVPPADPANGDRYIVATGATGEWTGKANNIAVRRGGAWVFYPPRPGWHAFDLSTGSSRHYNGSTWTGSQSIAEDLNVGGVLRLGREDGITATGTDQATARALTAQLSIVTTVAPGTGVRSVGGDGRILNRGSIDLLAYPPVGAQIETYGTNVAVLVPPGGGVEFIRSSSTLIRVA